MSCIIDKWYERNKDYKVSDLARFCGLSTVSIYNILDSRASPRVYVALKIVDYFNIYVKVHTRKNFVVGDFWKFDQEELKID